MLPALLIVLLNSGPACSERGCPLGTEPYVEHTPPVCPPCHHDSPPEACRCAEAQSVRGCRILASAATKRPARSRTGLEKPTALEDAPLAGNRVTRIASKVGLDYGFSQDGRHVIHGSGKRALGATRVSAKAPRPSPPDPASAAEDVALVAGVTGLQADRLLTARVSPRFLGVWVDRSLHAFDMEERALRRVEGAVAFKWFARPIPGREQVAYVGQDGGLYIADLAELTVYSAKPDGGGETGPFYSVAQAGNGIAYVFSRPSGVSELRWNDLAGHDTVLTTFCGVGTTVVKEIPGGAWVALHVAYPQFQLLAEVNVITGEALLAAPVQPGWSNLAVAPDGGHLLFGVPKRHVQPRELDLYLVKRRRR